jgi:hypothetical protein
MLAAKKHKKHKKDISSLFLRDFVTWWPKLELQQFETVG